MDEKRAAKRIIDGLNPYIKHTPTPLQIAGLLATERALLYGGAAGPGKSDFLLMASLQFIEYPGYASLLVRQSLQDLKKADALMDRAATWLNGTNARWRGQDKRWVFPTDGAPSYLDFGYCSTDRDLGHFDSSRYHTIAIDEAGQLTEKQIRYFFSRQRRKKGETIEMVLRLASNPAGRGRECLKKMFVDDHDDPECLYIPGTLADNPHVDQADYIKSLNYLDPVTRARLLKGDWDIREGGGMFKREWFEIVEEMPAGAKVVRYWDLAGTEATPGKDPDWTVGALVGLHNNIYYVADIRRVRRTAGAVQQLIKQTCALDYERFANKKASFKTWIEQEPGSSGKHTSADYAKALAGFAVGFDKKGVDKRERAMPVATQAEAGNVKLVRGPWNADWLDEHEVFDEGEHDDEVDATSGAVAKLAQRDGVVEYYRQQYEKMQEDELNA